MRHSFRILAFAAFSVAFVARAPARAADPPPPPVPSPVYWTFWAPSDFLDVLKPESSSDPFALPEGQRSAKPKPPLFWKEKPGFFGVGSIEDASPVFVVAGIPWNPAQDLAFFHKEDQRLYVRSSRESAELIDQFSGGLRPSPSRNIEVEVLLLGLKDPGAYTTLADADDLRAAAESLAADRGRIVARASLLTRSGQRASLGQGRPSRTDASAPAPGTAKPEEPAAAPAPPHVEAGLSLQAEPALCPDGTAIDLSVDFTFALRVAPGDVAPITGSLATMVTVRSGRPVLQRLSLEGAPWPEVALILSATVKVADVDGWKNGVPQLLPREEAWRALAAEPAEKVGR